jgi:hypothetical protein
MDTILHPQRVDRTGHKLTYRARISDLPNGTFVRLFDEGGAPPRAYLIDGESLLAWHPAGYNARLSIDRIDEAEVLTPRGIVSVLSAGYRPMLHPSAADR